MQIKGHLSIIEDINDSKVFEPFIMTTHPSI